MEIFGLPAHALVVHAAVVITPLAVLLTIAFAVYPPARYLTRWPTAVFAVAALGSVWAARLTGPSLEKDLQAQGRITAALIHTHESRGKTLALVMIAFTLLTLLGTWMLGGQSGLVSGRGERARGAAWVELWVPIVLVVVSIVTLVWVVLTGDAGSRVVWG